jgi:hypothetical protein
MTVRVTIETRNRQAAEIVAERLGPDIRAASWRGLGVIRVNAKDTAETTRIVEAVSALLDERHDLGWVRVRYEDEYRVFRSNGRRTG